MGTVVTSNHVVRQRSGKSVAAARKRRRKRIILGTAAVAGTAAAVGGAYALTRSYQRGGQTWEALKVRPGAVPGIGGTGHVPKIYSTRLGRAGNYRLMHTDFRVYSAPRAARKAGIYTLDAAAGFHGPGRQLAYSYGIAGGITAIGLGTGKGISVAARRRAARKRRRIRGRFA